MTLTPSAVPAPVRTFRDPLTGVTLHQVTDCPEGAAHLYFTRSSWTPDGSLLLIVQKAGGGVDYHKVQMGGRPEPLTSYPPRAFDEPYIQHMHRLMPSWEVDRNMIRHPAIHPTEPALVFALHDRLQRVDLQTGEEEVLHEFGPDDSLQGLTNLHTQFTADGRQLVVVTNRPAAPGERLDPPDTPWHGWLRDESGFVSRIWLYDYASRRMERLLFESNGEQSHPLTCPWDPKLLLWVNYLHKCFYTLRLDTGVLRRFLHDDPHAFPGHYSWDRANRRLTTLISDPLKGWRTVVASLDPETGEMRRFRSAQAWSQCHQNASPDGRWIVLDSKGYRIGGKTGLFLLDQKADRLWALCQLRCSWKPLPADDGRAVKSEFLHPNPSFSPDGRWVVVSSDFGSRVPQVYLVDLLTWEPRIRLRERWASRLRVLLAPRIEEKLSPTREPRASG